MAEVRFYDTVNDELLKFAVIISQSNGKWVFCKHKERDTYEVPGGHREAGENILETAKRELQEETGAVGKDYISLGTFYPSAGFCDEVLHLYFCKVASIGASHPDEDEFIEPILIPIEKAVEMVLNNEIPDGKTQVAVLKAAMLVNHKKV